MASEARRSFTSRSLTGSQTGPQTNGEMILLVVALLLLVLLSSYSVFAYRGSIQLLLEERRLEADRLARHLAGELVERPRPTSAELGRLVPRAVAVRLTDESGATLAASGEPELPAPSDSGEVDPLGAAEAGGNLSRVAGEAFYRKPSGLVRVHVELPAPVLRSRQRSLRILQPVVLGVNAAVVLLVLIFVGRLRRPVDQLLEKARGLAPETDGGSEEEFLLRTFERAHELLSAERAANDQDDLSLIEKTLVRNLESGMLLCDSRSRILAVNEVGLSILGLEGVEPESNLETALAERPEFLAALRRAIDEGRTVRRQECDLEVAGERRTLGFTLHPLRRDDGALRGSLALFADLTESQRETAQEILAQNLAQVGELAAGIAHEMRNSLATLKGYLTLVERGGEAETVADYVDEIRAETEHLQRVVEDFLSFARPGSARMEELDLGRLLRRVAANPALDGFPVRVRDDRAGGAAPRVVGDGQLLERALRNLLLNAVEAQRGAVSESHPAPPIELRWTRRGSMVEITVEDRGPGIAPEIRDRLFFPFASGRADGVGLGLALTHRIVELHRGNVRLEDRPAGGARATVVLPVDGPELGEAGTNGNGPSVPPE